LRIVCTSCHAVYSVDDALIKSPATKTRCPACGLVQQVAPPQGEKDSAGADARPASALPPPLPHPALAEPDVPRCSRCGSPLTEKHPSGLCPACLEMDNRRRLPGQEHWRVRKGDGSILGPFSTLEVREKFGRGEIAAVDMLARGDEDFRLISSFPEFAYLFRRPGENYRPPRPGRGLSRLFLGLVLLLLILAAAAAVVFWKTKQPAQPPDSPIEEIRSRFAREVGTPTDGPEKLLARAAALMARDERLSYRRADQILKSALALDPYNLEAGALWVKNRALIDILLGDASERKTALDLVDIMLTQKSDHPALLRARAFLLLAGGQSGEARTLAEKSAAAGEDPENDLLLAMTQLDSATELALEKLEILRRQQPKLLLASRLTAIAYLRLGRFHAARRVLEKRLNQDPGQLDMMVELARLFLQVGDFEAARENFENILGADQGNLEAVLTSSRIISQIKRQPQLALQRLKKFDEDNPQLPPLDRSALLAETALVLRLIGRAAESRAAAAQALELDANNGSAIFHLALAELLQNKSLPLEKFQEVQSHFPGIRRIRAWMAQSRALLDPSRAREEFDHLAQAGGEDMENILLAACFTASLDDLSRTYAWIKQAMAANPFYRDWYFEITPLYDRDVFWQLPEKWAREAAGRFQNDPLLTSLYAWVQLFEEKLQPAQEWFSRALEEDPDCFPANVGAGLAAWRRGQTERAVSFWQAAHRIEPNQPVAASLLALALSRSGKFTQAEKLLTGTLESSPGHRLAALVQAENWLAEKKNRQARDSLLQLYRIDSENTHLKSLIYQVEQ
jgi:predicted Zn finger-like uncharacterized protein